MISPRARVPSAHQVGRLMESLKNLMLPSVIRALTPPGCMLVAWSELAPLSLCAGLPWPRQTLKGNCLSLGVWATLKAAPSENEAHRYPRWLVMLVEPAALNSALQA